MVTVAGNVSLLKQQQTNPSQEGESKITNRLKSGDVQTELLGQETKM